MYESEILTIYKAENGFVVKCKQPPKAETKKSNSPVSESYKDEVNVYQNLAQVIKKVKEELAPNDISEDKTETDDSKYKSAFKEAAKKQ